MSLEDRLFSAAYLETADAVIALDGDGRVRTFSRGAVELLGLGADEARGRPFAELFERPDEGERLLELAVASGLVRQFRAPLRRADGSRQFAWLTARAFSENGRADGYLIRASSTTKEDGAENAVREALPRLERFSAVGQMAAAFAHDVRGPLHVVASTAEYAIDYLKPGPELRESLDMIGRNARRATASIKALLEFARAGRCELRPGSLNDVVKTASEFLESSCKKRGIAIERRMAELPPLLVDPHHLGAAIYNLMTNAMDAMSKGGRMTLTTGIEAVSGRVLLTVADDGAGMEPDVLRRVEEGFFSTKETGSGLGLYLTRRILSEHGAQMKIESAPGRGTAVMVSFAPVVEGARAAGAAR
ncbi:MAG: PAS domain-containing protein [Elusimicrobia bacterium]|nr:PAS domain-containing protein [Elusimicrobiota bacterium]